MIVAAIDSAELCGLAVLSHEPTGDRLLWHSSVRIQTAGDVTAAVGQLMSHAPDLVAVEEPFAHPRSPIAGMTLARLMGRWLQALDTAGLAAVTIPASMWQPATLPGFTVRMRSAERKAAAVLLARQRFAVDVGEDEGDAISLALYAATHASMGPGPQPQAKRAATRTAGSEEGTPQLDLLPGAKP